MNELKVGITINFVQEYLPTKKHKKVRRCQMVTVRDIDFKKIADDNKFPVALEVYDYKSLYRGAKSGAEINYRNDGGEFTSVSDEYRYFDGKFYAPIRISYGAAVSDSYEDVDYAVNRIRYLAKFAKGHFRDLYGASDIPYTKESIAIKDNLNERVEELQSAANRFIIYDNKIWESVGEPMYVVNTFGLGHNHGGTGMFIEHSYNPNISQKNYFNALQRDEAIAYANSVATRRGDTNDIGSFGEGCNIIVHMPETITRNPSYDHGSGDSFMSEIEDIVESSDSAMEAGLLTVLHTIRSIA